MRGFFSELAFAGFSPASDRDRGAGVAAARAFFVVLPAALVVARAAFVVARVTGSTPAASPPDESSASTGRHWAGRSRRCRGCALPGAWTRRGGSAGARRSEEHTSELQSR